MKVGDLDLPSKADLQTPEECYEAIAVAGRRVSELREEVFRLYKARCHSAVRIAKGHVTELQTYRNMISSHRRALELAVSVQKSRAITQTDAELFVSYAARILPRDMYGRIWDAVEDRKRAGSNNSPTAPEA